MQTFLPYSSYKESAKALDYKRLGKQRVETLQLLNCISAVKKKLPVRGWANHPCTKMWQNHSNSLVEYGIAICEEWKLKGFKDTCLEKIRAHYDSSEPSTKPSFVGNNYFHLTHKSKLIQKKPEYYKVLWPEVPTNLEYVWPKT
jgi:hypothetical protein